MVPDAGPRSVADARLRALAIVRERGWNPTSFQILGQGYRYYFDGDAVVAYVDTGSAWVGAGAPIAPRERLAEVADAFRRDAARAGRTACFFGSGSRFVETVPDWGRLTMGAQPVWRTARWRERLKEARSIAAQVRRAANKGVTVRRVSAEELSERRPLREEIETLVARWLAAKPMPAMGFLVDVQPFSLVAERPTFVAERDGSVVAVLGAVPIYARRGWLVETLARSPLAPNGTSEALIDAMIRAAEADGVELVTLGMSPLTGADVPLRLRFARWLTRPLYDFDGVHAFRHRLHPDAWEPLYLAVPPDGRRWGALVESLRAFAHGSIVRFALRSFVHLARRSLRLRAPEHRGTLEG